MQDVQTARTTQNVGSAEIIAQKVYTQSDFLNTTKPYEEVYAHKDNAFEHARAIEAMSAIALKSGVKNFKTLYKSYVQSVQMSTSLKVSQIVRNPTAFSCEYPTLEGGRFDCDDNGIMYNDMIICHHPILPIECLRNIDTGEEKLKIAFRNRGEWQEMIVSKEVLYNSRSIINLVKRGVDVSSETAKELVTYFQEIESLNRDIIPVKKSVGRLGYVSEGFSPYVDGVSFDGEDCYCHIFKAISERGKFEDWLKIAKECRAMSKTARIVLAASFASALVAPLGALPFFVHLWGVDSGTGKTVALMLAASVWGNPAMGEYIQTFNATSVGFEKVAAFLNSLPMCIDELQLGRDAHGRVKFDVYSIAQGAGRTRGTKSGGIDRTPTWRNCILTTGESPIVSASAGAGAVNRVIDVECSAEQYVIKDGKRISSLLSKCYGHAGKRFIKMISNEAVMEKISQMYDEYFENFCEGDTTEKQAMAAALILTADTFITTYIFKDDLFLEYADISENLKSKESVSTGERGYAFICDWVAANANRFRQEDNNGELYGTINGDWVYIISTKFRDACEKAGYNPAALLSWLKAKNLILVRSRGTTKGKRIGGVLLECVVMKLPENNNFEDEDAVFDEDPF